MASDKELNVLVSNFSISHTLFPGAIIGFCTAFACWSFCHLDRLVVVNSLLYVKALQLLSFFFPSFILVNCLTITRKEYAYHFIARYETHTALNVLCTLLLIFTKTLWDQYFHKYFTDEKGHAGSMWLSCDSKQVFNIWSALWSSRRNIEYSGFFNPMIRNDPGTLWVKVL